MLCSAKPMHLKLSTLKSESSTPASAEATNEALSFRSHLPLPKNLSPKRIKVHLERAYSTDYSTREKWNFNHLITQRASGELLLGVLLGVDPAPAGRPCCGWRMPALTLGESQDGGFGVWGFWHSHSTAAGEGLRFRVAGSALGL